MELKHFVYALDTNDGLVSAAISCPDAKAAQQAYQMAKRKIESEHGTDVSYHLGFNSVASRVTIHYTKPPKGGFWNGYYTSDEFSRDDFESAEAQAQKAISKGWIQYDVLFMQYVQAALTELFLGFDPHDVPIIDEQDKRKPSIPPWKSAIVPAVPPKTELPSENIAADAPHCPAQIQAASGLCAPGIIIDESLDDDIEDMTGKPLNVKDTEVLEAIRESTDVLREHSVAMKECFQKSTPASVTNDSVDCIPPKSTESPQVQEKRQSRQERQDTVRKAVKFFYDNEWQCITQGEAEKKFGLERGALSKGYGKQQMEQYRSNTRQKPSVDKATGDDFQYEKKR